MFTVDNRGKRSITVDMRQEKGQMVVQRLAAKADILLTNLLPERLEKFSLDSDTLHGINPGLIYAQVSPWGLEGAEINNPGFDMTAFFARGGIMSLLGPPGTAPVLPRSGMGDHTTGLAALSSILAALRLRDQTGKGTVVETSLMRTSAWQIAADMSTALVDGKQPLRSERGLRPSPLTIPYRCARKNERASMSYR
jgi:crotonobetainyl-CoA:carnitine CoA-transferase CaiB-like acyl-CoA transferase